MVIFILILFLFDLFLLLVYTVIYSFLIALIYDYFVLIFIYFMLIMLGFSFVNCYNLYTNHKWKTYEKLKYWTKL